MADIPSINCIESLFTLPIPLVILIIPLLVLLFSSYKTKLLPVANINNLPNNNFSLKITVNNNSETI